MTDSNTLADNNIKGFGRYVFCDIVPLTDTLMKRLFFNIQVLDQKMKMDLLTNT
jgi:hypothetical protein